MYLCHYKDTRDIQKPSVTPSMVHHSQEKPLQCNDCTELGQRIEYMTLIFNWKQIKIKREDVTLFSAQNTLDNQTHHKSYIHVTLMSPSTWLLPSQYFHLVVPSLTLGPASGDEGEFVALPLCIQAPVAVVELLMLQTVFPSLTRRNLVSPSTFLKTGRPTLHLPSSNLLLESPINSHYLNTLIYSDL